MITDAVLGLGSSLGGSADRLADTLALAIQALDSQAEVSVSRVGRLYRSPPLGPARGGFVNTAVRVSTTHSPRGLLELCKGLERRLGRRPSVRWADRVLDIDVLLFGGLVRRGAGLTLPHPELLGRAFALVPAAEVAPEMQHPVAGATLRELAAAAAGGLRPWSALAGPLPSAKASARSLAAGEAAHYSGRPPAPARSRADRPVERAATSLHTRFRGSPMKFFLDTANIDEIREAHSWGLVDGVTTNPSLIAREGRNFVDAIHEICEIVQGPVSAETVSTDAEGMVREGRLLAQVSEHVVVKVPLTIEGLKATRVLADDGIDVNVTLCFQPAQALLAAKVGAAYISPFLGRLDDISTEGVGVIEQIAQIYSNYPELGTEILAASIRGPMHIAQVAMAGADVATMPFKVLKALVQHPLTDRGLDAFMADWSTVPDNDITGMVSRWLEARGRS